VDNRLAVWVEVGRVSAIPSCVLDSGFYSSPLVLEVEPDLSYVGSTVHLIDHSLQLAYKVPGFEQLASDLGFSEFSASGSFIDESWRYRCGFADLRSLRAGLESRLLSAVRQSFPVHRSQIAVLQVFAISVYLSLPSSLMMSLLSKHASKYPNIYNSLFALVRNSIFLGGPSGSIPLVEEVLRIQSNR